MRSDVRVAKSAFPLFKTERWHDNMTKNLFFFFLQDEGGCFQISRKAQILEVPKNRTQPLGRTVSKFYLLFVYKTDECDLWTSLILNGASRQYAELNGLNYCRSVRTAVFFVQVEFFSKKNKG